MGDAQRQRSTQPCRRNLAGRSPEDPGNKDTHSNLGLVHYLKGNSEEAINELRKALEIEPQMADAHYFLGVSMPVKKCIKKLLRRSKKS